MKATTQLYAVIGNPIRHSKSPMMQTLAFQEKGIDAVMMAFEADLDTVECVVDAMKTLGVRGFNVTMPLKEKVAEMCDTLTGPARLTGAVNTVRIDNGRLVATSTDGTGFFKNLHYHEKKAGITSSASKGKTVLLGAGGAASSILAAAVEESSDIVILNRTVSRAQDLLDEMKRRAGSALLNESLFDRVRVAGLTEDVLKEELRNASLLINATSIGMAPHEEDTPVPAELIPPHVTVCDIVYNPQATRLLREASARGCFTVPGIGMLIGQGADAFEFFTGEAFPEEKVREAVERI